MPSIKNSAPTVDSKKVAAKPAIVDFSGARKTPY